MGDNATLYGFPVRLVLTIEGRDVNVPNAFDVASSGVPVVSCAAVMKTIMDARRPKVPAV